MVAQAIRNKNKEVGHNFYKHITIDNVTRLEEMSMQYAITLYKQTPMGKAYTGTDIRTLPNGSGYIYLRQAIRKVIDMFKDLCDEFILIGHTKETTINKEGEELSSMELDLVGKLSTIICGEADAVGYIYRKKNETHISFAVGDNIIIADSDDDGNITTHWDLIYKDEEV